jgi:hypothetical protein
MNYFFKKLIVLIATSLSTFNLSSALEQDIDIEKNTISTKEKQVLIKVAKVLVASHENKQNKVWEKYDLTESPVVITFKNGHVFAFNLNTNNPLWQKISVEGINMLFSPQDYWGFTRSNFQPQFPLEGQQAYVFNLDKAIQSTALQPYLVLIHERFHLYEFENFQVRSKSDKYQDHLNKENLALGKVEEKILANFMRERGNPECQLEHLKDYVAINTLRKSVIQKSSVDWENHQQIMEGLADYVSYKMLDVFPLFAAFDGHRELANLLNKEAENTEYSDHAIKWRHYSVGASLGYALDFLNVRNWKNRIEQGEKQLSQLMGESVVLSPSELEARIENCKILYHWDECLSDVSQAVNKFENEIAGHIQTYNEMEGVILEVGRPRVGLSGSGSNKQMFYLSDGSTLSLKDTLASSSEDNLWHLNLHSIPYVFKKSSGIVEFKVEFETKFVVDHKNFSLKQLMEEKKFQPFSHLEIHGKDFHFTSSHEGALFLKENGALSIRFR